MSVLTELRRRKNASAHLWRGIHWFSLGFLDRALDDTDQCLAIAQRKGAIAEPLP
jgi:hypothetical protein